MIIEKKELVNLFYVLHKMNIGDLTANHASVLSKKNDGFYINKHKFLFSQINYNNLNFVKLNENFNKKYKEINKAGFYIHKYLHQSVARPKAILHTHSINSVAISVLKNGFNEKLNQSSMRFYKRVKYFDYNGMVMNKKEGQKLQKLVDKNTKLIVLKNHGLIILANTIAELFHLTFHFEKCAQIQLILNNNNNLIKVSNRISDITCKQHESFGEVGKMSWKAIKKEYKLI